MKRTSNASRCRTSPGVFETDSGETASWLLTGSIYHKLLQLNPFSYSLTQAFLFSALQEGTSRRLLELTGQ